MINYNTLTKDELKEKYSNRHGFVFKSGVQSSDKAIEHLCNTLVQYKITKELPEVVVKLEPGVTVFVYKDDFDGPAFFQKATIATQVGVCNIDSLYAFLKN